MPDNLRQDRQRVNSDMIWNELIIKVGSTDLEKAAAIATAAFSGELYIEDFSDISVLYRGEPGDEYINPELAERNDGSSRIHLYFSNEIVLGESEKYITERLDSDSIKFNLIKNTVSETDWAENWKQYYTPQKIGKKLVICPSWQAYSPEENEIIVTLDPGMSFGTGEHESTRLCLVLLEDNLKNGERLLDIGSGSGILSISALKLGAGYAAALDIDPDSVRISMQNAILNGVDESFNAYCADITDPCFSGDVCGDFDLITANITSDIHTAVCGSYKTKLRPGGRLILSGIIDSNLSGVIRAIESEAFQVIEINTLNNWVAVHALKQVNPVK